MVQLDTQKLIHWEHQMTENALLVSCDVGNWHRSKYLDTLLVDLYSQERPPLVVTQVPIKLACFEMQALWKPLRKQRPHPLATHLLLKMPHVDMLFMEPSRACSCLQ